MVTLELFLSLWLGTDLGYFSHKECSLHDIVIALAFVGMVFAPAVFASIPNKSHDDE